jgi:integrase
METVQTFTGLTVHPHLFRSIAGSLYLDANPGDIETLRQVLGHKSINTTARFYAAHMARKSQQHFTDTVRKLRETADAEREKLPKGSVPRKKKKS